MTEETVEVELRIEVWLPASEAAAEVVRLIEEYGGTNPAARAVADRHGLRFGTAHRMILRIQNGYQHRVHFSTLDVLRTTP